MSLRRIDTCFSPLLFDKNQTSNAIMVVCDVLRATTSICTALENGAKEIIPIQSVEEARLYKQNGYVVAAERDGKTLDFADFGNSPFNFTRERVEGKSIAYSTTNGTKAVALGEDCKGVVIGAFINLSALANYLQQQPYDVLILCSGWKGRFCLEDTLFAGALSEQLLHLADYETICDSTLAAIDLWNVARHDLSGYIQKIAHRERLRKLGLDDVLDYCFTIDSSTAVPILSNTGLKNLSSNN